MMVARHGRESSSGQKRLANIVSLIRCMFMPTTFNFFNSINPNDLNVIMFDAQINLVEKSSCAHPPTAK